MNENLTHNELAKIGQAINLACNQLRGTEYTQNQVINLVFDKYLPLIKSVQNEYVKRRESMTQFIAEEEPIEPPTQMSDELDNLF